MSGRRKKNSEKTFDTDEFLRMKEAGERIKAAFKDINEASEKLLRYFSRGTLVRYYKAADMDDDYARKIGFSIATPQSTNTINLILGYYSDDYIMYNGLLSILSVNKGSVVDIKSEFSGRYKYFRYHISKENLLEYVIGTISISSDRHVATFRHYRDGNPEIRHDGYVFLSENKLYMLGRSHRILRLSITDIEKINPKKDLMHGALSSISGETGHPFSSHFILVNERNKEMVHKLSDDRRIEHHLLAKTEGEKFFLENMPEHVVVLRMP